MGAPQLLRTINFLPTLARMLLLAGLLYGAWACGRRHPPVPPVRIASAVLVSQCAKAAFVAVFRSDGSVRMLPNPESIHLKLLNSAIKDPERKVTVELKCPEVST